MSSNSVASVIKLDRLKRFVDGFEDDDCGELLSSAETAEGDDGSTGAAMKWIPLGVGKWSLSGDSHCSIFRPEPFRFLIPRWWAACLGDMSSFSSSIIVLRRRPFPRPCEGEGSRYVALDRSR